MSLLLMMSTRNIVAGPVTVENEPVPNLLLQTILEFGGATPDGRLVAAVALPWRDILKLFKQDPAAIYQMNPEQWEHFIAGCYSRAGFDVVLTPRSGELGRDVIATKHDLSGAVRIFDQVKAYKPGHLVPADDVRALAGVLSTPNVSKGIVTTTSHFAPGIKDDRILAPLMPYRLQLRDRESLLGWLDELSQE